MNTERISNIKEMVEWELHVANRILNGDHEGYDGADGARIVRTLCGFIQELLEEVKNK